MKISKPMIYKSLLTGKRTTLHFDNGGKYGLNYLECQVLYVDGSFKAYITNGFRILNTGKSFSGLKAALNWGHTTMGSYLSDAGLSA